MDIYNLPTGFLFSDNYEKGQLETLSIGDYGKSKNVKADFLGYKNEINGVPNEEIMPMSEKWVITVSTQYGCPMKCVFCDCPSVGFKGNASFSDLKKQFYTALSMFPDIHYAGRINLHFARMGEPAFNQDVLRFAKWVNESRRLIQSDTGVMIDIFHPVLTSSCPKNVDVYNVLSQWAFFKNHTMNGGAGLQISINSTNEGQRKTMFGDAVLTLEELSAICKKLEHPLGRKYCLNFAYADGYEIDGEKLARLFPCDDWMCKITPIHNNTACKRNGIETTGGYGSYAPYRGAEESLKSAGFDTLVFVPSMDEENGLITCGNAVLSGRVPKTV